MHIYSHIVHDFPIFIPINVYRNKLVTSFGKWDPVLTFFFLWNCLPDAEHWERIGGTPFSARPLEG